MKKIFTYLLFAAFSLGVSAQLLKPITFEGDTAGIWSWYAPGFGNGTPDDPLIPDVKVVENPFKVGSDKSDSVLYFKVNAGAEAWAGTFADGYGPLEFTEEHHTLSCMVYKTIISNVAFKLEREVNGGANVNEIKVPNTLTDEWEALTFDMTPAIGFSFIRLTFFPDFPDVRLEGSITYIDNIYNTDVTSIKKLPDGNLVIFPNPVENRMAVQYPGMKGITISNILGKTVKSIQFQAANSKVLELGDLKTGVYFISVETGSGLYTSKFMKR